MRFIYISGEIKIMNPEDIENIVDIVPEKSRNALFESPLRSIGYAINGFINLKLGPLIELGAVSDASIKSLAESVNEKAQKWDRENIDHSKLGLSLKAIDEVGYQIENETLREMFANLIAKSVDKKQNLNSSPLMLSTLTSMSPESAEFLSDWHNEFPDNVSTLNQIDREVIQEGNVIGSTPILQNIVIFNDLSVRHNEYVVDELNHLGIFELHLDGTLTADLWQQHYEVAKRMVDNQFSLLQNENQKIVAKHGFIRLSPFGASFIRLLLD